ncbi:hypothetical protein ACHAWU_005292 [Discostella pseudostelligera]|uniref:RRM domain-containing protein n=1 Tax=Discostella pseudostelligera TaxID=259834 RepID=A0ABD3N6I3_9STRA
MMEEASGLGYDSRCGNDDGSGNGIAAATGGGEAKAMMFVSAVVADADADDARDGHDENGNDIFQQSMPPLHQLLPPRPMMPDPYFTAHSQQQQQLHQEPQINWSVPTPVSVPSADSIPSPDITSAAFPTHPIKEDGDVGDHCINPIEKARAIAKRFQQENLHLLHQHQCNDTSIPININYAQLRHQHFQKERSKLQIYTLKNLEYIMKHEEQQLRQHVAVMNEMVAYEEAQDIHYQLRQEQQKQYQLSQRQKQEQREIIGIMNEGGGGIGSVEQRRAERARRKRHPTSTTSSDGRHCGSKADASSSQHHPRNDNTTIRTSLYLTNLPTDGSTTERTLQSLFCSYGRLDRVTMYRHRDTGLLKGDGLIVFGRDAVEEYRQKANNHHPSTGSNEKDSSSSNNVVGDLVEAVCAQMNGAELPSGHIMGVQPAQMDYYSSKQSMQKKDDDKLSAESGNNKLDEANVSSSAVELNAVVPVVAGSTNNNMVSDDKTTIDGDDEEDLDDFFASLE